MARNYNTMEKAWKDTIRSNPYQQEIVETKSWWKLDNYLVDTGIARDVMKDSFPGMELKDCSWRVIDKLWQKIGNDRMLKDWIEYNDKAVEIEQGYNVWWWMDNDRECYKKED